MDSIVCMRKSWKWIRADAGSQTDKGGFSHKSGDLCRVGKISKLAALKPAHQGGMAPLLWSIHWQKQYSDALVQVQSLVGSCACVRDLRWIEAF